MRGTGVEFDDVDDMVTELGPKGALEAFVKAREHFDKNPDNEASDQRSGPITGKELKDLMLGMEDEDEEE